MIQVIPALLQLIQAGATIAPIIQSLRGKDPTQADRITSILNAAISAMERGAEGAAYLQTLGGQLQALHDAGLTITHADLDNLIGEIQAVSNEIEAQRRKLDETDGESQTPPTDTSRGQPSGEPAGESSGEPATGAVPKDSPVAESQPSGNPSGGASQPATESPGANGPSPGDQPSDAVDLSPREVQSQASTPTG